MYTEIFTFDSRTSNLYSQYTVSVLTNSQHTSVRNIYYSKGKVHNTKICLLLRESIFSSVNSRKENKFFSPEYTTINFCEICYEYPLKLLSKQYPFLKIMYYSEEGK